MLMNAMMMCVRFLFRAYAKHVYEVKFCKSFDLRTDVCRVDDNRVLICTVARMCVYIYVKEKQTQLKSYQCLQAGFCNLIATSCVFTSYLFSLAFKFT